MTRARRRDPRRLESLALDAENRRTHTERNVEMIARALREVGAARSIVIDEHNRILAGNGVATAAKAIGLSKLRIVDAGGDEIVAVRRTSLSADQKRALALYDNRAAELAEWNLEQLALDKAAGLAFAPFWTDDEAAALFAQTLKAGKTDPDAVPELRTTDIALGDCFALGAHRLVCGDATDPAVVDRASDGRRDLMLTDPPYGIGYEYIGHDDTDPEANARLVLEAFAAARCAARVWTPGKMNLARELLRTPDAKVLCWHKKFAAAGNGLGGASTWEPILVAGVTHAHLDNDYLAFSTDREPGLREQHSCPKPVALWVHLLAAFTPPGAVVFDPFLGSGTTFIAGEQLDRAAIGVEIVPQYCQAAIDRWEGFTGRQAVKLGELRASHGRAAKRSGARPHHRP